MHKNRTMYIVVEVNKVKDSDACSSTVRGVHRQIKQASVQAWTLYLTAKTEDEIVQKYCEKGTKVNIGPEYKILCWDERPDHNALVGTWFLETPPFSLSKDKDKKREVFLQFIKKNLEELSNDNRTPSMLWNNCMRHEAATPQATT